MSEREYWLGFSVFKGIGPVKFKLLLKRFGSAEKAWKARDKELIESGIGKIISAKFVEFRDVFFPEDYAKKLKKLGVFFVTLKDKEYPKLLKEIDRPPFVFFVKGNEKILHSVQNDRAIAIVGTRKTTHYGREITKMLTAQLVLEGYIIVSGLAMGVDAVAHQTTIDNNGKTIAVLGCGVDCCTPSENSLLYNQIIEKGGLIVSELPLGCPPTKGSFPARNRIIAGLSQAVLVTEGAQDSGSLITADYAFKFKRPVFAVPGPITSSLSKGPFKLIQKGAKLAIDAQVIVKELGSRINESNPPSLKLRRAKGDTKEENIILKLLESEPLHFDEIVRRTKMNSAQIAGILSVLEIKGMIKSLDQGLFSVT